MLPSKTTKSWSETLTSGGRISIPICSACVAKNGTLSFVDMTELISAAMYSAGKFAFSQAVRYAIRP